MGRHFTRWKLLTAHGKKTFLNYRSYKAFELFNFTFITKDKCE